MLLLLNVFEPEEIGARIHQARERAGLRQEDLADLVGVANRTIQNYEAGATKPFAKLKAIAQATGVTVEWLLHGDDATQPGADDLVLEKLDELLERVGRLEEAVAPAEQRAPARRRGAG